MNGLLFIDDEEGIRRAVSRALKREPYRIYTAGSGEEGIALIRRHADRMAIVISDFKMPGLDGMKTLIEIGTINPEIARILLTGYATMASAIEATNRGIDGFLTKPFDNLLFRAHIREIFIRKRLKQFVPEQVVRKLETSPMALSPTFSEATILFSDIRGFTRMTQYVPPAAIAEFLNEAYFTPMGEIAYGFGGTVDKHIGDSIMVVFGAPVARTDDPIRAVRAAIAMQIKTEEIDARLAEKNGLRLKTGIGISTGRVFSGVLGSLRKKEFTSVGTPVNIAARLQGLAGPGEVIISHSTYCRINGRLRAVALPPVRVKGVDEPIAIYRVPLEPDPV